MPSKLQRLGDCIFEVDKRNSNGSVDKLIGVSIEKTFMNSVANIIGTDLTNYKLIEKNNFACSLMQVSRDGGIAVSLYNNETPSIMSPAYYIFGVNNQIIIPEYLDLIFKSSEFDREAVFMAVGGVRGTLTWDDFCDLKITVPDLQTQKGIIEKIHFINAKQKSLTYEAHKLDELIDSIYHTTFDGCERNRCLSEYVDPVLGGTPSTEISDYWNGNIGWINSGKINDFRITKPTTYITEKGLNNSATKLMKKHTVVIAITGVTLGQESILLIDACGNQSVIGIPEHKLYPYEYMHPFIKDSLFELLKNQTGGAQPHINKDDVKTIKVHDCLESTMKQYKEKVTNLYNLIETICFEIDKLDELKDLIVNNL